jgi:hypothetical protein
MTLNELYNDCEKKGIDVDYFPMKHAKGLAFPDGWIALDVDKIENSIEEKEVLAHEEAHIETGSFYNVYSPLDIKAKHERRANVATIKKLVPRNELIEAISCGFTEHWQLAEYFDVSDRFMLSAMEYYNLNVQLMNYPA